MARRVRKTSPNGRRYMTSVAKLFGDDDPGTLLTIAPSILAADFADLRSPLKRMVRARCYWTHVDVMDGHFAPNIAFGPPAVRSLRAVSSRLFLDTHLMIEEPQRFLEPFAEAGSDMITVHAEAKGDLPRMLRKIRSMGLRAGVSIRPRTPLKTIEKVLDKADLVLIMTVEPGFGGQALVPNALSKVRQLAQLRRKEGLPFLIQVDGGINLETVQLAVYAGANVLVAGTAVFGPGDVGSNLKKLADAALGMDSHDPNHGRPMERPKT